MFLNVFDVPVHFLQRFASTFCLQLMQTNCQCNLTKGRIAAAIKIDPSYSPVGASVHHHLIRGSLGPQVHTQKLRLGRFNRFSRAHQCDQNPVTHTDHAAPSVVIGRTYAVHAMRPIDVKTYFTFFYFSHVFLRFNAFLFSKRFLCLKNVGKVQIDK